jgi:hypothetical protein
MGVDATLTPSVEVRNMSEQAENNANDMDLWPRIEKAIYAAGISRHDAEWCLPIRRRKNCQMVDPGHLDDLYRMFIDSVRDTVYTELLCKATSDPDFGDVA